MDKAAAGHHWACALQCSCCVSSRVTLLLGGLQLKFQKQSKPSCLREEDLFPLIAWHLGGGTVTPWWHQGPRFFPSLCSAISRWLLRLTPSRAARCGPHHSQTLHLPFKSEGIFLKDPAHPTFPTCLSQNWSSRPLRGERSVADAYV